MATQKSQSRSMQIDALLPEKNKFVNMGTTGRLASAAVGAALASVALGSNDNKWRAPLLALGGGLLLRGAVGYCPVQQALGIDTSGQALEGVSVSASVTVRRPVEEVYSFWRKLENLPQFMSNIEDVREIDNTHSYWVAKIPASLGKLSWEAEIIDEQTNQLIVWHSLEGADIENAGTVHFIKSEDGEGTEVHVHISYSPPAGELGDAAAALLNGVSERIIKKNMRDFKALMEEGLEEESSGFSFKNLVEKAASLI